MDPRKASSPQQSRVWIATGLLMLIGLAAYANSFRGEFIFDDAPSITNNPSIRKLWPLDRVLFPPRHDIAEGSTVEGRPLLNLSFALNYAVGGLGVESYHTANLAIHLLCALVLFGIVRRTLMLPACRTRIGDAAPEWLAFFVAAIWMAHPLQTESVTYISQRAESLCGLFYLLTIYLTVRGLATGSVPTARWWKLAAVTTCIAGMAAKEVMVTAPLMALFYDWTFIAGSLRQALRERWKFYLMLMSTWAVQAALLVGTNGGNLHNVETLLLQLSGRTPDAGHWHDSAWSAYALTQFHAIVRYLWLSFWPSPLIFDYGHCPAQNAWEVAPAIVAVVALLAGTVAMLRFQPWLGYAAAWFFLILAPTSSVVPLYGQTMAEHRMYLPLAGVVVVVVMGFHVLWQRAAARAIPAESARTFVFRIVPFLCATLVVVILASASFARNVDYQTGYSIWRDTARKHPGNLSAHSRLGTELVNRGQLEAAVVCFEKILAIDPNNAEAHNNLGKALFLQRRVKDAIEHFKRALALDSFAPWHNLATAQEHERMLADAIGNYGLALEKAPDSFVTLKALAWLLATCPETSLRDGKRAVGLAQRANDLSGGSDPNILMVLAVALAENGQSEQATVILQQALRLAANTTLDNTIWSQWKPYLESRALWPRAVTTQPSPNDPAR